MFFSKKYADMVFFQLDSYYTRSDGIKKIVSECLKMFDEDVVLKEYGKLLSKKETTDFLGDDKCYCICFNERFDEAYIETKRCFDRLYGKETYILFMPYKKRAYIEHRCSESEIITYFISLKENE